MFNLESAKPLERTFERKGSVSAREQKFEIKHRSANGKSHFTISTKTWEALDLGNNKLAVAVLSNTDKAGKTTNVAFRVVDLANEDAKLFKKSAKGDKNPTFNSTIVEGMLQEAGILEPVADDKKRNQYISLSEYTEGDVTVYVLTKDPRDVSEIESYNSSEASTKAGEEDEDEDEEVENIDL